MAVAVHPGDERYTALVGRQIRLPITGRLIPIVVGRACRSGELGSGAVKITPGHDFNDFEVGQAVRASPAGEMLNMLDAEGDRVVQTADGLVPGGPDRAVDRFEARRAVVARLKDDGFLDRACRQGCASSTTPHRVRSRRRIGDRSGRGDRAVADRPMVCRRRHARQAGRSTRCATAAIKDRAADAGPRPGTTGSRTSSPGASRASCGGVTRSPPGTTEDGRIVVALTAEEAQAQAAEGSRRSAARSRPTTPTCSTPGSRPARCGRSRTLGWPTDTRSRASGGPATQTTCLISGFDILFFWDARMAMQGMHFMGDQGRRPLDESVPFTTLYLHGLVRDADRIAKMSKSKGNTVDPLGLIDRYGADALRFFTLAAMESQGRDIKLDETPCRGLSQLRDQAVECRAFRFSRTASPRRSTLEAPSAHAPGKQAGSSPKPIRMRAGARSGAGRSAASTSAANTIYQFVMVPLLRLVHRTHQARFRRWRRRRDRRRDPKAVAGWAFDQILVLLHPFHAVHYRRTLACDVRSRPPPRGRT